MSRPTAASPHALGATASAEIHHSYYYGTSGPAHLITVDMLNSSLMDILRAESRLKKLVLWNITTERFRYISDGFSSKPTWPFLRTLTINLVAREDDTLHLTLFKDNFPLLRTLRLGGIVLTDCTSLNRLTTLKLWTPASPTPARWDRYLAMLMRSASTLQILDLRYCLPPPDIGVYTPDERFELPQIRELRVEAEDLQPVRSFFDSVTIPAHAGVTLVFPQGQAELSHHPTPIYFNDPFWTTVSRASLQIPTSGDMRSFPRPCLEGPHCLTYIMLPASSPDAVSWLAPDGADGVPRPLFPQSLKKVEVIADWSDSRTVNALWAWLEDIGSLEHLYINNLRSSDHASQLDVKLGLLLQATEPSRITFPHLKRINTYNVRLDGDEGAKLQRKMVEYARRRYSMMGHGLQVMASFDGIEISVWPPV